MEDERTQESPAVTYEPILEDLDEQYLSRDHAVLRQVMLEHLREKIRREGRG